MNIKTKNFFASIVLIASVMILAGCANTKQVAYFQNIDTTDLSQSRGLYDARIMPKDELTINVTTSDPEVSQQFTLTTVQRTMSNNGPSRTSGNGYMLTYLVENDGTINFPLIGRITVQGLTKRECEDKIAGLIKPYLANGENPVVTVEMSSYHVTVIGEVGSPGVKTVTANKISILEALAQAGDLTIYGKRENILLIREDAKGEKHSVRLNLNDAELINSPYFYLQQNDVVYVEPNKVKAKNSDIGSSTTLWMSFVSFTMSLASFAIGIFNK